MQEDEKGNELHRKVGEPFATKSESQRFEAIEDAGSAVDGFQTKSAKLWIPLVWSGTKLQKDSGIIIDDDRKVKVSLKIAGK